MEDIKPITNQGFFSYVFKLSRFKQEDLMNIIQYTILSIIPVLLFVYFTKKYFPLVEADDSSLYIFIVTFLELVFMIIGIFFIDRIINFIPTFSGKYYEPINLTTIVIIFVLFMLLINTGFRERTKIMLERFDKWFWIDDALFKKTTGDVRKFDIFTGDVVKNPKKKVNNNNNNNKQHGEMTQEAMQTQPLPTQGPILPNPMTNYGVSMPTHQAPNTNNMYANASQQMDNSNMASMNGGFIEPMAANDACGSSWSKW
jgi:hypothetical protein